MNSRKREVKYATNHRVRTAMPTRVSKRQPKIWKTNETTNAFAKFSGFCVSTTRHKAQGEEMLNWNLIFIFNFAFVVSATWKLSSAQPPNERTNEWMGERVTREHKKKKSQTMMTCPTRIPTGIGFKQYPFTFFLSRHSSPLSLSPSRSLCHWRSGFVINFDTLLSSCSFLSRHIFREKNNNKVSNERKGFISFDCHSAASIVAATLCRCLVSFFIHFSSENIIKSTAGIVIRNIVERKKNNPRHIVLRSIVIYVHSVRLSLPLLLSSLLLRFNFVSVQLNETHFETVSSHFSVCKCAKQRQSDWSVLVCESH